MFAQRPTYVVRSQRTIPGWRSSFGVIGVTVNAPPIAHSKNTETITAAAVAVCRGTMDIAPADSVEGILIAQLMAANEASVAMYTKSNDHQPHAKRPRRTPVQSQIETNTEAVSCLRFAAVVCMEPEVVHRPASVMGIIGTVRGQKRRSRQ
jgi:hypothetical protein